VFKVWGVLREFWFFLLFFFKKSTFDLFELSLVYENMSIVYED